MSLGAYDAALLVFLKKAFTFDNIINSADSEAFDNMVERKDTEPPIIHVPLISFWRISNTPVLGGGNFRQKHTGKLVSKDFITAEGERWRSIPIEIFYQITIWSDRRKEVDDIYRELLMYLMVDEPYLDVLFDGTHQITKFILDVTDADTTTDITSFSDKGRLYSQNIMVSVIDAQLVFSRNIPLTRSIPVRILGEKGLLHEFIVDDTNYKDLLGLDEDK